MDKDAVLAKLQELHISHTNHGHAAPVMTCDAQVRETGATSRPDAQAADNDALLKLQAADLAGVEGAVTKNLFLKVGSRRAPPPARRCRRQSGAPCCCPCLQLSHCASNEPSLWVQDKRGRLYIVTALADTKVDLKSELGWGPRLGGLG